MPISRVAAVIRKRGESLTWMALFDDSTEHCCRAGLSNCVSTAACRPIRDSNEGPTKISLSDSLAPQGRSKQCRFREGSAH